jgi:tripeptide aminopeptidase
VLQGGRANNIVADEAYLSLEARSRNRATLQAQVEHMKECLEEAARHYGGEVRVDHHRDYEGYNWSLEDLPVRIAAEAWRRSSGAEPEFRPTGGGSDANVFNARGIPAVVVSCGYLDAHTVNERVPVADMMAAAGWAVEIARVAAAG